MIGDNEVSYKPVFKTPGKTQKWRNKMVCDNYVMSDLYIKHQIRLSKGKT